MSKDNNISIKLEVMRDKSSKKLIITAHFDSKANNVFIDKDNYSWMPTIEERDLLNDAFSFFPSDGAVGSLGKTTVKTDDKKEEHVPEPPVEETTPPPEEEIIEEETIEEETIKEEKPEEIPPLENPAKAGVFKRSDEEPKIEEIDNEPLPEVDEQPKDENKEEEKKLDDDAMLVEADGEAIQRALKKHTDADKDDSMVEVDEQTIIEKVLSQKKKGKWSKKQ